MTGAVGGRAVAIHRKRVSQVEADAAALAGTMQRVASAAQEVLTNGGTLQVQQQFAFATGALARLLKDMGVIEQLQSDGVSARPYQPPRR